MAVRQVENHPRVEVKARIAHSLHERLVAEAQHCGCHLNGIIAIAIAREVSRRRKERQDKAYLDMIAEAADKELEVNA